MIETLVIGNGPSAVRAIPLLREGNVKKVVRFSNWKPLFDGDTRCDIWSIWIKRRGEGWAVRPRVDYAGELWTTRPREAWAIEFAELHPKASIFFVSPSVAAQYTREVWEGKRGKAITTGMFTLKLLFRQGEELLHICGFDGWKTGQELHYWPGDICRTTDADHNSDGEQAMIQKLVRSGKVKLVENHGD